MYKNPKELTKTTDSHLYKAYVIGPHGRNFQEKCEIHQPLQKRIDFNPPPPPNLFSEECKIYGKVCNKNEEFK